ncbi:MAG: phosphatase PAP2 family protein [Deltaproteobacteria bacterium]|nr:phosphatase PAP2 family protein [Deltaproteobacteria bacterium]
MRRMLIPVLFFSFVSMGRVSAKDYVKYNPEISAPITLGTLSFWLAGEFLKDTLAPKKCRWCRKMCFDELIRKKISWGSDRDTAHHISNIILASIPIINMGFLGFSGEDAFTSGARFSENGFAFLVGIETLGAALFLNQAVKFVVARERPLTRYTFGDKKENSDLRLSFYSGHTTAAFAFATASSVLIQMKGWKYASVSWGVNMTLATLTGYFRIAADRHYFSDVLIGAITGIAAGLLIPRLHKVSSDSESNTKSELNIIPKQVHWIFSMGIPF